MDQHLFAEWRELPRMNSYAKKSKRALIPDSYVLGTGHVSFFYNKKAWLSNRYKELTAELIKRGYDITDRELDLSELDKFTQIDWIPDNCAILLSKERIQEKISQKPNFYRFYGKKLLTG